MTTTKQITVQQNSMNISFDIVCGRTINGKSIYIIMDRTISLIQETFND